MTGRKCSTCRYYEPAPIWRKGWCRNPELFGPQQSHLVGEEDLDCERGMGNYWVSIDGQSNTADVQGYGSVVHPLTLHDSEHPYPQGREILTTASGQPVYAVSGSSGYSNEPPQEPVGPGAGGRSGGPPSGRERQLTYYSEDRYWADYIRIILPIIGVILMVVLFYFWASAWLGGDDETGDRAGANGTGTPGLPIISASPTNTTRAGATGTPRVILTAPPAGATTPAATGSDPTETPAGADTGSGDVYAGATVVVANTGGTGANMRSDADTEAEVVAVLLDGTELTTTGEAVEAGGFIWWPVEGEAGTGYVVADYLQLVE